MPGSGVAEKNFAPHALAKGLPFVLLYTEASITLKRLRRRKIYLRDFKETADLTVGVSHNKN